MFHDKPRAWFDKTIALLLAEARIKRMPYQGGKRYCPPEAAAAIPKHAPTEAENDAPEAEESAPEEAA